MSNLSLETLVNWANAGVVISLALSFVFGAASILLGSKLAKIKDAQAEAAQRNLELAVTTQQERAAKAELDLERLRKDVGQRQINREAFLRALEGQPKAPVQILYLRDDPDSLEFAQEIDNLLKRAKWIVTAREPIPTPNAVLNSGIPVTMSVGGQPSGVTVVARSVSQEESDSITNAVAGNDWVKTPWTVLYNAFSEAMGRGQGASHETVPKGTLRVVIGPKFVR